MPGNSGFASRKDSSKNLKMAERLLELEKENRDLRVPGSGNRKKSRAVEVDDLLKDVRKMLGKDGPPSPTRVLSDYTTSAGVMSRSFNPTGSQNMKISKNWANRTQQRSSMQTTKNQTELASVIRQGIKSSGRKSRKKSHSRALSAMVMNKKKINLD